MSSQDLRPDGAPEQASPAIRLVRIGRPAGTSQARAARAEMAGLMAPEIAVTDIDTRTPFEQIRRLATAAGPDPLPWALLTLPGTTAAGAGLLRRLAAEGTAPTRLLVRAEAASVTAVRAELEEAAAGGAPLSCPVVLLLTAVDGAAPGEFGGWDGLAADNPVVRVIGPAESHEAIATIVKEELQVWPA